MHNEVLEDDRQNKMDLTRLIKTFTLDLVTEYNLEVRCFFHCINKSHRRRTASNISYQPMRNLPVFLFMFCFVCLFLGYYTATGSML